MLGDIDNIDVNPVIKQPLQCLAAGGTTGIAPDPEGLSQGSLSEQSFHSADKAVGTGTGAIGRAGADCDITIDAGAAAQPVVGRTISQVDLFDIAARGEVLSTLHDFHNAGAALADATAVVEIVEALVGIDSSVERCLAEIGSLDATDLLAFLLKTDGGHGSFTCLAETNLQASGVDPTHLQ